MTVMLAPIRPPRRALTIERADVLPELRRWDPRTMLGRTVRDALPYLPDDLQRELVERVSTAGIIESCLRLRVFRGHGLWLAGLIPADEVVVEDYGIVSRRVVTTVAVNAIVDAFGNTFEPETWDFHGIGTGVAAEAIGDTTLGTELTTQYNPDNTRATGAPSEPSANVYRTVGTNTLDSGTPAVTEHGVFPQAATGGGILLDRSVFAAINLNGANGDGLQSTYDITFTAGG